MSVQSFIHDQFDRTATLQIISEYQEPGKSTASIDFFIHLILAIGLQLHENSGKKGFCAIFVRLIYTDQCELLMCMDIILTLVDHIPDLIIGS